MREALAPRAIPAVRVQTSRGMHPLPGWENFHDTLMARPWGTEDMSGCLDVDDDWYAVVERSSALGAQASAKGTHGVAVEGDALFENESDPLPYREDYLREAGANPELYDLSAPVAIRCFTFFPTR